jgi:hypothetical protein
LPIQALSGGVSLHSTFALDSLELAARYFELGPPVWGGQWQKRSAAACGAIARRAAAQASIDGLKQAKDNRYAFCLQGKAFTKTRHRPAATLTETMPQYAARARCDMVYAAGEWA